MAKPPRPYTRLTRAAASVGSYKSLWLASDHLLLVTSTGYTEDYHRLQLREIKGFFIIASDRRLWWGVGWGTVAGVSAVAMIVTLAQRDTPVFSVTALILSSLVLLWNYLLGPVCRAYVVTGVQTAPLPSLVRRRKAVRVIGRIQPLIEAAQADLGVPAQELPEPPAPPPPLA